MERKHKTKRYGEEKGVRVILLLLAVFLQSAVLSVGLFFLSKSFALIRLGMTALALCALVHLQSSKMSFECKYPWAIFLLLFPAFASVLYALCSMPRLSKKKKDLLREIYRRGKPYRLREGYPADDYLTFVTGFLAERGDRVTYFPMGQPFFESLQASLSEAKKFIFLEYFILANGSLWSDLEEILKKKAKNGVEIRILYDEIGSHRRISPHFLRKMEQNGIHAKKFIPTSPILSAAVNNRDHRKIAVIDGETAYVGGSNLADEYDGREIRFGVWKDCSVKLQGGSARQFTLLFLEMWSFACGRVEDFSPFLQGKISRKVSPITVQPFADGPRPFYEEKVSENLYVHLIERADETIRIMTPYFIVGERVRSALHVAVRRGVKVELYIPGIPDKKGVYLLTKKNCRELIQSGVYVYTYTHGFLHSKLLLTDGKKAVCGTANFDYRSLRHHFECGVLLTGELDEIERDFEETKRECTLMTVEGVSLLEKIYASVGSILAPLL